MGSSDWSVDVCSSDLGLDASSSPETWPEVCDAARRSKESGWPCGLTTTWPTWIGLENFSAWNNVPYGTKQNGLEGAEVELLINSPLHVQFFQALADLQKEGVFKYGGRTSEAKQLFLSGECAILTESSGGLGELVKSALEIGRAHYQTPVNNAHTE